LEWVGIRPGEKKVIAEEIIIDIRLGNQETV
jgi:hypothetical protein